MEKRVFLFSVASPIHTPRVGRWIRRVRRLLRQGGMQVEGVEKAVSTLSQLQPFNEEAYDAIVAFVASGGTSSILTQIIRGRRWVLLAYPENNSLPSALSAREKLEALGGWRGELVYSSLQEAPPEIVAEAEASAILRSLRNSTFLLVREGEKPGEKAKLRMLREVLGLKQVTLTLEELGKIMEGLKGGWVRNLLREKIRGLKLSGLNFGRLEKPFKLYLALRKASRGVGAVTIDCFPFILREGVTPCLALALLNADGVPAPCEADLDILPLFLALARLEGKVWMANLAGFNREKQTLTLAHCTANPQLCKGTIKLKKHFETGKPISLDVPLPRGVVTLAHLSLKPLRLTVALGRLVRSQLEKPNLCRSQAEVRVEGNLEKYLASTGNHQILCWGNKTETLIRFGRKLGGEVVAA